MIRFRNLDHPSKDGLIFLCYIYITYSYDAVGNLEFKRTPDGYATQYIYNDLNRLTDIKRIKPDGATVESWYKYTPGNVGEIMGVTESSGRSVSYSYDDCYRLIGETVTDPAAGNSSITYKYDKAGNRKEKTENGVTTLFMPDDNGRVTTAGAISYNYDDNGNLKSKSGNGISESYSYDIENHLTGVTVTSGGNTSTETYDYDWEGNRIRKTTDGSVVNYLVDETSPVAEVIEERDGSGTLLAYYTYGDALLSKKSTSGSSYYNYDASGNVRALTDKTGTATDSYSYDAYGIMKAKTGSTKNSYLFAGEQFDEKSGLYYLRARYMDTTTGTFITSDPYSGSIGSPMSLNKYLYANGSPVNFTDPTGYDSFGELMTSMSLESVINSIADLSFVGLRSLALNMAKNAVTGSVIGGAIGGIDGALSGEGFFKGFMNGSITGAEMGALFTIREFGPLLIAMGRISGVEGVIDALRKGNYKLAAFR
ncbi:MAG TPA: RHS repeat-associated core domain-containing protein, partial [Clostridia bacterium]